jgi:hypothetical protein
LATFGEGAKEQKLGGIPSRGEKALHPPEKADAHARFTKSGQEPKLFATENKSLPITLLTNGLFL